MTKYISSPERMETEDKEEAEAQSEDNLTEQINTRTERREKRTKKTSRSPSGSRTRICWKCREEADHFALTCPSKAKPGNDTPYNRPRENSGSRGTSQGRARTNMIKSGYGSDTEEEEEQEDEKYSEEDLTEQSLKERKNGRKGGAGEDTGDCRK